MEFVSVSCKIHQHKQRCKFEVFCIMYIKNICNLTIAEKRHVGNKVHFFYYQEECVMVPL